MKIAQVAPLFESVPPRAYGGTERVVSYLTEALVAQGHDVTLFASGDSQTAAELVPVVERSLRLDPREPDWLMWHMHACSTGCSRRPHRFDVIHFHIDCLHYPLARRCPTPCVTTLHGRLDLPDLAPLHAQFRDHPAGLDLEQPARAAAARRLVRDRVSRPAADAVHVRARSRTTTSRSSAASRRKSASTARSRSPSACGMPLRIAAKVDPADRRTSSARSSRCSTIRWSSSSARSAKPRRTSSSATRARCCSSRSTGPSRSGW